MSQVAEKSTKQRLDAAHERVSHLTATRDSLSEQIAELSAKIEADPGNFEMLERTGGRLIALERLAAANSRKLETALSELGKLEGESEHECLLSEHERLIALWIEQNKQYKDTKISVARNMLDLAKRVSNVDLERSMTQQKIRETEKKLAFFGTNKLFKMGDIYKAHEVTPSQKTADAVGVHKSQVAPILAALESLRRAAAFTGKAGELPRVR